MRAANPDLTGPQPLTRLYPLGGHRSAPLAAGSRDLAAGNYRTSAPQAAAAEAR
jgi:hypothetical protein